MPRVQMIAYSIVVRKRSASDQQVPDCMRERDDAVALEDQDAEQVERSTPSKLRHPASADKKDFDVCFYCTCTHSRKV